jgi:hypothetical protein
MEESSQRQHEQRFGGRMSRDVWEIKGHHPTFQPYLHTDSIKDVLES